MIISKSGPTIIIDIENSSKCKLSGIKIAYIGNSEK